jgi:hypothetical protein
MPANAGGAPIARIAIVQFETRSLLHDRNGQDHQEPKDNLSYWRNSARLNAAYACAHGYDYLYYHTRPPAGNGGPVMAGSYSMETICFLHGREGRAASWCSLAAIADALSRGYERVVKIGSDAFLKDTAPDIEELLRTYYPTVYRHAWPPKVIPFRRSPRVFFAANTGNWGPRMGGLPPVSCSGPNGDLHVWERSVEAWKLLRKWWLSDDNCTRAFNRAGLQEQTALTNCRALRLDEYGVLCRLQWNDPSFWSTLPGIHAFHSRDTIAARTELLPTYARQIPSSLVTCVEQKLVEQRFNPTRAAARLLESPDAAQAFESYPSVSDPLGLDGSTLFSGCPGPPLCFNYSGSNESRVHPASFRWEHQHSGGHVVLKRFPTGSRPEESGIPGSSLPEADN